MLFSSLTFVYLFLPVVLAAYFAVGRKYKNAILLSASILFYSWCGLGFLGIMLTAALMNWAGGLWIDGTEDRPRLRRMQIMLAANLCILGFFKYSDFFISGLNYAFGANVSPIHTIAPIGMSFYIFKAMSYIFDVCYKTSRVQKNPYDFMLYVSMFPALLAGPIVKYHEIDGELGSRAATMPGFMIGIRRFVSGLAKKVLIADSVGAVAGKIMAAAPADLSVASAWVGALACAFQIYYDFSGYSDMAVGLGKMLGFNIPENFNYPFTAKSIQEYWQRWHITMSLWFKEYLFYPLMKSPLIQNIARTKIIGKKSAQKLALYITLMIFWFLIGLWHGAAWTMIIGTGLLHGSYLIISDLCMPAFNKFKMKIGLADTNLDSILRRLTTFFLVIIGYIMLFSTNIDHAAQYIGKMFMITGGAADRILPEFANRGTFIIMAIASACAMPLFRNFIMGETRCKWLSSLWLIVLLALSTIAMVSQTYMPFMYFQF